MGEGTYERLDGSFKKRSEAVNKCFVVARDLGFHFFALADRGRCWAGYNDNYKVYEKSKRCPPLGKGFCGVANVYIIVETDIKDSTVDTETNPDTTIVIPTTNTIIPPDN